MPRLFTAVELPEQVAMHLSLLRGGLPGARWIDKENYHVTLRFIGDIDDRTADEVAAALDRVERRAFTLQISGLDVFSSRGPHALFARVEPTPSLLELQGEQERLMQRLGLKPEPRRFHPHVTLARLRGTSAAEAAQWLAMRGDVRLAPIEVSRFVLYSSRASVGGGPYLVEEAYPLLAA
ncbi:RNA 2',3'-cyclic phosphodiesterase [Methylobrevis pamukkalensis]|uniref:RNA 2',3'-cyclic phosphodiesterase n=1 Tax=Methylobrevis pamukkalensis TaxID=1439726 RepID=A0A1E3H1T2_9HYPH|nr:RNA 2',3'-cyclic phosphodiesterase [Methylobrevis pamukkalensis]ODN70289.1 2',5' RNA ligase family [Methylobrevis pamukkalensis]